MIFGIVLLSIVFLLAREVFQPSPRLTAIHIGMYFTVGLLTLTNWGVCIAFKGYWPEIVSAYNQLATFEHDWEWRLIGKY